LHLIRSGSLARQFTPASIGDTATWIKNYMSRPYVGDRAEEEWNRRPSMPLCDFPRAPIRHREIRHIPG
jgi:hypothetical protein